MASLEPWALALVIIGSLIVGYFVILFLLRAWAKSTYQYLLKNPETNLDLDAFCGDSYPPKHLKVVLITKFQLGSRMARSEAIPLECVPSEHVEGLWVSQKSGTSKNARPWSQIVQESEKPPIVIATIRMGFGHHRLAYSAASWALAAGRTTVFHDLLNIESQEADLIRSTDELYSRFSRYASELGGVVEKAWGSLMKAGDADALRVAAFTAAQLQPLLLSLGKDTPLVTTHQLVALTASAINCLFVKSSRKPRVISSCTPFLVTPRLQILSGFNPLNLPCTLGTMIPLDSNSLAMTFFSALSNPPRKTNLSLPMHA